ncbi:unnamed protein product [Orchesella dallaii]|uniref:HRDC domain-containing protein n=1 Tax=Orchesella dallaii TaxID=48710 RepID=A0ABP1QCA5_9HEXA
MQNIKGHELTQASLRWGVQNIRPHSAITGFLEWRKGINNAKFPTTHPYEDIICDWRITSDMVATTSLVFLRILKYIRTEPELIECTMDLETLSEFTVDTEMNTDSYFHVICTIQVSTHTTDYVVDALTLFSKIKDNLGPILEDPLKLKLFHSCNDLIHLQRNFGIYTVGMIDTQEAYEITTGKKEASLSTMVKDLLDIDVNKLAQRADWRLSPLPQDLIEYAAADTKLLFQCWLRIKHDAVSIESESFPKSRQRLLQLVSTLKVDTSVGAWHAYCDSIKNKRDMLSIFATVGQRELFVVLFEWRQQIGKEFDIHPNKIIREKELQFVTRAMPTTIKGLKKICFFNKYLTEVKYGEVVKIIEAHRLSVFNKTELAHPQPPRRMVLFEEDSDSDMDWEVYLPGVDETSRIDPASLPNPIPPTVGESDQNEVSPPSGIENQCPRQLSMSKLARKQRRYRANVKIRLQEQGISKAKLVRIARRCVAIALKNGVTKQLMLTQIQDMM